MAYPYESNTHTRNNELLEHDAALPGLTETLPGRGLTETQWLQYLLDNAQDDVHRLIQSERHFKDALQTTNHQLRMRTEELDRAKHAIDKVSALEAATGGMVPEFQVQGNFTICLLIDPFSERVYTGVACCGRDDTFNLEIGKAISLGRAMNQRAEFFASNAYAK